MKRKMNIALIGLGNIGSYLFRYINKNRNLISSRTGIIPIIKYVSVKNLRKKRKLKIPKSKLLSRYYDAPFKKDVDIIIELIGGSDGPAKKLAFEALKNRKHFITANKALIAKYGDQLSKIAENKKVNLEYEAAVCGGVPIIRSIKEGLIANKINKVYGILNGTSNFVLSSMKKNNISFLSALDEAKRLGYAESNPKSDINGDDVSSKLKILSSLAFNSLLNKKINIEGINNIDIEDINNAKKLGYNIKLIGIAELIGKLISQRVYPALINNNSNISNIDKNLNAVIIEGDPVGKSIFQGEGAGAKATTSALISDLCSILRGNIKFPFAISSKKRKIIKNYPFDKKSFSSYLRFDVLDKPGVLSNITNILSNNKISIKRLVQNPYKTKKNASIVIITHNSKNKSLIKSLKLIKNKDYIINIPKLIRIENI